MAWRESWVRIPSAPPTKFFQIRTALAHIFRWLRAAVPAGLCGLGHTTPARRGWGHTNPQDHPPPAVINGAGEVLSPPRFAPEPQKRFRSLADGCCPAWGNPMA